MNILKYILLAIVLLGSEKIALPQYYMKVKSDTLSLENDSILLFAGKYRGVINWQVSPDLKNWTSLNNNNDTLAVRIDSSAYYRATIIEGTCNPVVSDTVFLIEKLTKTTGNLFTVDSKGGVFLLPSGIKVKIPKGAVTGTKEIKVDMFGFNVANAMAPINVSGNTSFLSGFSIATDLFDFKKPIKIKIPLQDLVKTNLPFLYKLNNESKFWVHSNETMVVSVKGLFVEIILGGSVLKSTLKNSDSGTQLNDIRSYFLKLFGDILHNEDTCRKIGYDVIINDVDKTTSGGCSIINSHEDVVYWGCDPPRKGTYVALEITSECNPQLQITPGDDLKVKKNESLSITLTTLIGDYALEDQSISLSVTGPIGINPSQMKTDKNGTASFSVTGKDVGKGVINLSVSYEYYLATIYSNDNGKEEYNEFYPVKKQQDYSINVTVYDLPEVTTGSVTEIKCTSATIGGNVIKDNYDPVTDRGVIVDGKKYYTAGSGLGEFSASVTGLESKTTYSVKAYAANSAGTSYGSDLTFTLAKCDKPSVTTTAISNITPTAATCGGNVTSDGGATVTARGVCWGKTSGPLVTGNHTTDGNGTGTFVSSITGLTACTQYYVRSYAVNSQGTAYGNEISFTTSYPGSGTVTDIDGNIYHTVIIGAQCWMVENLRTTGSIPNVTDPTLWYSMTSPAYCWYNNDKSTYGNTYGALYNWYAVNTGKLCPAGWHVPSDAEWTTLTTFLGGELLPGSSHIEVVGGKLKETGTAHWNSPNTGATNEYCFSALPGGWRGNQYDSDGVLKHGVFLDFGISGVWWTSSEGFTNYAYYRGMYYNYTIVYRAFWGKVNGLSVRCVRD